MTKREKIQLALFVGIPLAFLLLVIAVEVIRVIDVWLGG